ncbi:MAG: hypothetical protein WDZ80_02825 [Candidatus Paceibacterota bacterium]
MKNLIPIKEIYKNLKEISKKAQQGDSFIVLKHSKPVFRILPPEDNFENYSYELNDINKISFSKGGDLSKKIDSILYGKSEK